MFLWLFQKNAPFLFESISNNMIIE